LHGCWRTAGQHCGARASSNSADAMTPPPRSLHLNIAEEALYHSQMIAIHPDLLVTESDQRVGL
jgi:hypothetical protein